MPKPQHPRIAIAPEASPDGSAPVSVPSHPGTVTDDTRDTRGRPSATPLIATVHAVTTIHSIEATVTKLGADRVTVFPRSSRKGN